MRITENCVFSVFICWGCLSLLRCKGCFYVSGSCVVVTVQNVFCVLLCYTCVQQSGKQICNNNISLFSKGIQ